MSSPLLSPAHKYTHRKREPVSTVVPKPPPIYAFTEELHAEQLLNMDSLTLGRYRHWLEAVRELDSEEISAFNGIRRRVVNREYAAKSRRLRDREEMALREEIESLRKRIGELERENERLRCISHHG